MRPLVFAAALVVSLAAHAQPARDADPRPSGSGADASVEGGASLGATDANAPAPRTAGMPPRPGDDLPPRPGDYARPDTRDTQARQDGRAEENPAQEMRSAEAKEDREAATGATSPWH